MCWLRCRLSFSLLRSSIMSIRGARSPCGHAALTPTAVDLVNSECNITLWTISFFHLLWTFYYCACIHAFIKKKKIQWIRYDCASCIPVTIILSGVGLYVVVFDCGVTSRWNICMSESSEWKSWLCKLTWGARRYYHFLLDPNYKIVYCEQSLPGK